MIHIPGDCPTNVKKELTLVFRLYLNDRSSCLNRIRKTLELVLDDLKIPKKQLTKKRKMHNLSLHHRIEAERQAQRTLRSNDGRQAPGM